MNGTGDKTGMAQNLKISLGDTLCAATSLEEDTQIDNNQFPKSPNSDKRYFHSHSLPLEM